MNRIFVVCVVAVMSVCGAAGCASKAKKAPIAAVVEEDFRTRWVAKRMAELQAGGVAEAREARRMALEEFKQKYEYTSVAKKPDAMSGAIK